MFFNIDLKNEYNASEILQTFDRFFFAFGRFPAVNELIVVPTGDVPSFVEFSDVISPSELYKRYNSGDTSGLVCVHLLAALTLNNALSEFLHNLSMQALSKSDDAIVIKFDAINRLNKSLNDLLSAESLAFDTARILRMTTEFFDRPIFVTGEQTDNKRIENSIVRSI